MPARGRAGSCLRIYYKTFSSIELALTVRQPGPCVRACFVGSCCADVVQEHDFRATPVQGNAKRRLSAHFTLHSSHLTLHTSHLHFALHTSSDLKACELFSPHLSSSHLIPSLLTCHQSKFNCFHLIRAPTNLSHLLEVVLNSPQLFCTPESSYCQRDVSCTKKTLGAESFCTQTLETQMHLDRKAFPTYFVL